MNGKQGRPDPCTRYIQLMQEAPEQECGCAVKHEVERMKNKSPVPRDHPTEFEETVGQGKVVRGSGTAPNAPPVTRENDQWVIEKDNRVIPDHAVGEAWPEERHREQCQESPQQKRRGDGLKHDCWD